MDKELFEELKDRFDDRYKKLDDCDKDMDAVKKEHSELVTLVAKISTTLETNSWVMKTFFGAFIAAVVAAVFAALKLSGG